MRFSTCRNTWRKAAAVLPGRTCRHKPASRSTSAGSVISVRVSAPVGVTQTSSSLLPQRSRCTCWRLANGRGRALRMLRPVTLLRVGRRPAKHPHDQEEDSQDRRQAAADDGNRLWSSSRLPDSVSTRGVSCGFKGSQTRPAREISPPADGVCCDVSTLRLLASSNRLLIGSRRTSRAGNVGLG